MRSFALVLFMFMLGLSPSTAQIPCETVTTPLKARASERTPGYMPVVIIVEVPLAEGADVSAEAKKAIVIFWISGAYPVRQDVGASLNKVRVCSFTPQANTRIEKTYLSVRAEVVWEWNEKERYYLRTGIFLPRKLVAAKPTVRTELPDGTALRGEWGEDVVTFTKRQRTKQGVRHITVRQTVATLLLRPQ